MTQLNSEIILVECMQKGDVTALSALMQLYQKPALQWAMQIVRDNYLAEDAVQEAFAQLQRKIPSLKDPSRFRPWFRQMVRRLALNQIRGSHNRIINHEDIAQVQQDIEAVHGTISNDPLEELLQQHNIKELLHHSLSISSEQARSVMHAHAIENYNPDELAAHFQTSKGNIYNIISRSRVKANEERFRNETAHYLVERRRLGLKKSNMLEPPSFSSPYSLMSVAIKEVLRYAGSQERSLTDIMGISGDAFRLSIATGCHWRGISTFDWSYAAFQTMERLGWQVSCFGRPGRATLTPEQQVEVLRIIQASIDVGLPVIIWNLAINQFGLVYGYDDEAQTITYRGFRQNTQQYAYNQLGRNNEEPALFVAALKKQGSSPASDTALISSIINHLKGKEPPLAGFAFGLSGYQLWMESVENGSLDLLGHAYQVAILAEARLHAVKFLQSLYDRSRLTEKRASLAQAVQCMKRVSETIQLLYPSFPFGYGGSHTGQFGGIIKGLKSAFDDETLCIHYLEQALEL